MGYGVDIFVFAVLSTCCVCARIYFWKLSWWEHFKISNRTNFDDKRLLTFNDISSLLVLVRTPSLVVICKSLIYLMLCTRCRLLLFNNIGGSKALRLDSIFKQTKLAPGIDAWAVLLPALPSIADDSHLIKIFPSQTDWKMLLAQKGAHHLVTIA